jgi:hypothetical protein
MLASLASPSHSTPYRYSRRAGFSGDLFDKTNANEQKKRYKKAYLKASMKFHPDKCKEGTPVYCSEVFKKLTAGNEALQA